MINLIANPSNLTALLAKAQPGDVLQLATGAYPGSFTLSTPGVTIEPAPGASPAFTGPPVPTTTAKPAWLHVTESAKGATLRNLVLLRDIPIAKVKPFNDYGIVIEAPNVTVDGCRLAGMVKGIHVKERTSTGFTIVHCHVGPTFQSNIAIATSYGVMRGGLIAWNLLELSCIEDGIQFTQNFEAADRERDVSNLGVVIYQNRIQEQAENAIDLKGAAYVVIDGNVIRRIAGSNDGPLNGWNTKSPMAITHGAGASSGSVIIRNNDIQECAGGIRVWPGWKVYNNLIANNNFSRTGQPWAGTGILQRGGAEGAAVKNNLVAGHKAKDLDFADSSPDFECNPTEPGPGVPLTHLTGDGGIGNNVPVADSGYFTGWFGRGDLPPDVIWAGDAPYTVRGADNGRLDLYRIMGTPVGTSVFWRSPSPVVGIQPEYKPVEPPTSPTEPTLPPTEPTTEPETPPVAPPVQPTLQQITLSFHITLSVASDVAATVKDAVGRAALHVETVIDALPPGAVRVYDPGDDD